MTPALSVVSPRIERPEVGQFKLRIGGAHQPREDGFIGLDRIKADSVDHALDLKSIPWPIEGGEVDTIYAAYYLYRLDMAERIAFMNECGRILRVGAQLILQDPHWKSMRAIADPRSGPGICELSFAFFNKEWREKDHYDGPEITCDFDYGYGVAVEPELHVRNQDYQNHASKYWTNSTTDIHVTLTKRG